MFTIPRRSKTTTLTILAILAFSTFVPALAYAAPLATSAEEWQNMNGNTWAWNYSPETQINNDNVNNLEVKWIFPIESVSSHLPAGYAALNPGDGSSTPPLVINGKVYIATNYQMIVAVDAETGQQVWTNSYNVDLDELKDRIPIWGQAFGGVHNHGFRYWAGGNALINRGIACDFYGVDADTGETSFWLKDLCVDIPGNLYAYSTVYGGAKAGSIGVYEKGNQFIYVQSGAMHSSLFGPDARHVTMGIDITSHDILWRVFEAPPQDQLSKDWATQECDIGYFDNYPCTDVAAQNPAGLEWDWAMPNEPPSMYGGVTANWGQMVVDEDTGIIYTNTGNQGPYGNMSLVPGPRLYGSTIMAIDMNKGQRVWWLQPFPHDAYDYDCNWSGILAELPGMGKVYMKGCKDGVLYAIDAATGKPIWRVDVVEEQVDWGQYSSPLAAVPPEDGGLKYHRPDPFSTYELREYAWPGYPGVTQGDPGSFCTLPCTALPYWANGLFGTDMSFDPDTNTLFHYASGQQVTILAVRPYVEGSSLFSSTSPPVKNATIVARDAMTGTVKWTWFYEPTAQRSHIVVTSDMIFSGFTDGKLRFFDKNTGALLREMNLGTHMVNGFTTGQDSNGDQKLFGVIGVGSASAARLYPSPTAGGALIAVGLNEMAAGQVRTTTITTTARTTLTTTSTTTSVSTSSTTVTSSTTRTVTTTTATTITSTMAPQTTTMTTTAPAMTVTSTEEVSTGMSAEVTYAAIAIAVIAIIAAAVLAMRRQ